MSDTENNEKPRKNLDRLDRPGKYGGKLKSGNTKNVGRKKKMMNLLKEHFLSEKNIKLTDKEIKDLIKSILYKSKEELLELAQEKDLPFWVSLIANKASKDFGKGSIEILELLLDRSYGKPKQEMNVSQEISFKKSPGEILKEIKLEISE